MNHSIKAVNAGILALALGISNAWAMSQDEAKTQLRQDAVKQGFAAKDVSHAVATLNDLIQKGVPVDQAYKVVDACVDQGIRGKDLAEVAKTMTHDLAQGIPADKATEHAMARIQEHARVSGDTRNNMREEAASPARGEMGQSGSGSGMGSGFGGGDMTGGAGAGSGSGMGGR